MKLSKLQATYTIKNLQEEINILADKSKFIVTFNSNTKPIYNNIELEEVHFTDFSDGIVFKPNSIKLYNPEDSLLIPKLNLFLALNGVNKNLCSSSFSFQVQ